jgi:hypothetical protein
MAKTGAPSTADEEASRLIDSRLPADQVALVASR